MNTWNWVRSHCRSLSSLRDVYFFIGGVEGVGGVKFNSISQSKFHSRFYVRLQIFFTKIRMHSSRMRTSHSFTIWRGTLSDREPPGRRPPGQRTPLHRDPKDRDLQDIDPPDRDSLDRDPPGQRPHLDRDPPGQRPHLDRDPPRQRPHLDGDPPG